MSTTVDVQDVQRQLSELLSLAKAGNEIIIAEGNIPVARLVPFREPRTPERRAGLHQGAITTSDDFDEPLPEAFWTGSAP